MEKKTKKIEKKDVEKNDSVTPQVIQIIEKEVEKMPSPYLSYSTAQLDQIKDVYAKGASDVEFANFIIVATRTGLDIFKRQIYLVPRWDSRLGKEIFSPQTGIDGYRAIAERTNAYAGNDDPVFKGEIEIAVGDKKLKVPGEATITIYKIVQGVRCPFTATARWSEYYPGEKVGFMWKQKPHVMLGKCAEALALRKAFPNVLGGIYTAEEMAMQDSQIKPLESKKVDAMFEKAKKILANKTDVKALEKDLENVKNSEKFSDAQKKELCDIINLQIKNLNTQK